MSLELEWGFHMKIKMLLASVFFLALQGASQDTPKPQTQAQCKFADGKKVTVTYSSEHGNYQLSTEENLITVKGIHVPAGDYTIVRAGDRENQYNLIMRRQTSTGRSWDLPRLPLSASTSDSPVGNFAVSFDQTGGSCVMHWRSEKSNLLLSLEFAEKNTDLPVIP